MRLRHLIPAMLAFALAGAGPAAACITVGVYQDNPSSSLSGLKHSVGSGITVISTYLTAGQPLAKSLITTANRDHASLLVTWDPDGGRDSPSQPKYRLSNVARGHYDASLRALVAQLRTVRHGAILRPMPEMNTPWYAWSGTVNHNSPKEYIAAWRRVRKDVESARGGHQIKLLWAPYAQSIPATTANEFSAYFPGSSQVDLVGASGYNFGAQSPLSWTDPGTLFGSAYAAIESLAHKPFWLAETGSTAVGGDKAGWILSLATLQQTAMPELAAVVWYDVDDPTGDFRLRGAEVTNAFKSLLQEACR
jgi:mannan endo-1,4-beta-mannosidase